MLRVSFVHGLCYRCVLCCTVNNCIVCATVVHCLCYSFHKMCYSLATVCPVPLSVSRATILVNCYCSCPGLLSIMSCGTVHVPCYCPCPVLLSVSCTSPIFQSVSCAVSCAPVVQAGMLMISDFILSQNFGG